MISKSTALHQTWLIIGFSTLLFFKAYAGNHDDPCSKTNQLLSFISTFHIQPPPVNESFNQQVRNAFMEQLDPAAYLLTKNDAEKIHALCPQLPVNDCKLHKDFIKHITGIYTSRLLQIDSLIDTLLAYPLDFTKTDSLHFSGYPAPRIYKSESELFAFWEQYLRFQVLRYYITTFKQADSSFEKNSANFNTHQAQLRAIIKKQEHCRIAHMLNMDGDLQGYILSTYLNAVTTAFDPHSNYFSQQEKAHFDHLLSRNKFSFGIDLDQNRNGDILVTRLIPGGPAWRSNKLDEGDVLISIQFENKEPVDLTCSDLYEIENLIYQSVADQATLTVRNQFGQIKTVELKMEFLEAVENVAYSFIMDGACKIGYITLPAFYTEPGSNNPLGCAADLAKELIKLKNDQVDGIILDVRNNGGGSVNEAVDLAGVFIDNGPLCMFTNRVQKPQLLTDVNPGVLYDGPLLVMVNQMSASASEILAGILKDYNRAVVVGNTTFGKATGQNIFLLGDNKGGKSEIFKYNPNSTDFVKVTTARYFNLHGTSHQQTGLQPDVPLPAVFTYTGFTESGSATALPNTEVAMEVVFNPFPALPVDSLKQLSLNRLTHDKQMTEIAALGSEVEKLYTQKTSFPLYFDDFKAFYSKGLAKIRQLDSKLERPAGAYTLLNNTFDASQLMHDEYMQKVHKEMINNISKNIFIEESYKILCDFINIQNRNTH